MESESPMNPIYAKIFGNETVQPVEEDSPISLQFGEFCVSIETAGGSVTIKVEESVPETDTISTD